MKSKRQETPHKMNVRRSIKFGMAEWHDGDLDVLYNRSEALSQKIYSIQFEGRTGSGRNKYIN